MSSYLDLVESAVIVTRGVVLALVYGAFNVLVISAAVVIVHGDLLTVKY